MVGVFPIPSFQRSWVVVRSHLQFAITINRSATSTRPLPSHRPRQRVPLGKGLTRRSRHRMSRKAEAARRHWAQPIAGNLDANYLPNRRVDACRGRLRVHRAILAHIPPKNVAVNVVAAIWKVLQDSSLQLRADCRVVDEPCNSAMDSLLEALPVR